MIVFDIETGPIQDDELQSMMPPVEMPEHPGVFNPDAVRVGNLKDSTKILEKIAKAREDHEAAVARYDQDCELAKAAAWDKFKSGAALSPITGKVLAVGTNYCMDRLGTRIISGDERDILVEFWDRFACGISEKLIGWNIFGFDLPFLVRRSWKLNVKVPSIRVGGDRYWSDRFIDLQQKFAAGLWNEKTSLDNAARFLGVGRKNGHGSDFAKLWNGTEEERRQAVEYLENDLLLTLAIAERLGVS